MKNLILILATMMLTACGGAEFTGEELSPSLAGEAGEAPAAAGSGAGVGGSGGTSGGSVAMGGGAAGQAAGGKGGSAGSAPVACEFDPAMLAPALPTEIDLGDFSYTSGDLCVSCRDGSCGTMRVISWGEPIIDDQGRWQYRPNTEQEMVSLAFGANDGMCTEEEQCGTKPNMPTLVITTEQRNGSWVVASAELWITFYDNACVNAHAGGGFLSDMSTTVSRNVAKALNGRQLPCVP